MLQRHVRGVTLRVTRSRPDVGEQGGITLTGRSYTRASLPDWLRSEIKAAHVVKALLDVGQLNREGFQMMERTALITKRIASGEVMDSRAF